MTAGANRANAGAEHSIYGSAAASSPTTSYNKE